MELVISAMDNDDRPTVLFGFHSPEFSQCVYMNVEEDPIACLKMAQDMADGFVTACGEAVKKYRAKLAEEAPSAEETRNEAPSQGSKEAPFGEEG